MIPASRLLRRPTAALASSRPALSLSLRSYATDKPPAAPKVRKATTKAEPKAPAAPKAAAAAAAKAPPPIVPPPEQTNLGDAIPSPPAAEVTPSAGTPSLDSTHAPAAPSPTPEPTESLTTTPSLAEQFLEISDVAPPSAFGAKTGARAKGAGTKSSIEKRRQNLTRSMLLATLFGAAVGAGLLGREWEDEMEKMRLVGRTEDLEAVRQAELGGWEGWLGRARLRGEDMLDYLNKPAWDPLLPPPLPEPHFRPYTLVLDLDDLLVHSSWDINHGWRTAKRPGVDYFLAYLSQFYEIVLFTTQPAYTAAPIVEKIDPYGAYIPWKLYRESTRYKNKTLIKDLSYLGRPLERTIILDTDPSHFQLQPSNGILLTPWKGTRDETAKELVSLIPFLEALAIKSVKDVRPVIQYYDGKHIPTAYAEAEAKAKKTLVDKWEADKQSASSGVAGWISAALGSLVKQQSRDTPPETDVEKVRKSAQRMYQEEQKYWKDNEEMIKKQMDDDREKQLKEMKSSLLGFMGVVPPRPAEEQQQQQ